MLRLLIIKRKILELTKSFDFFTRKYDFSSINETSKNSYNKYYRLLTRYLKLFLKLLSLLSR